jgi:hypothetical protein
MIPADFSTMNDPSSSMPGPLWIYRISSGPVLAAAGVVPPQQNPVSFLMPAWQY